MVTVSAHQADGVVITEVVESHPGQVGQSGKKHPEVRLPVRLGQLEQETESFLKDKSVLILLFSAFTSND